MSSYQEYFTKLKTAKIKGQAAPHKAVMLLSVIDLIERKEIGENAFYPDDRLESRFKQLWETHVGNSPVFQPTFATPFYHLGSEPFWSLRVADGAEMEKLHGTPGLGYLRKQKAEDLKELIENENLKPEETEKFIKSSFRDGQVRTTGTDIDKILPPMSRFGGGNRQEKKKTVIEKIQTFFERYFWIINDEQSRT